MSTVEKDITNIIYKKKMEQEFGQDSGMCVVGKLMPLNAIQSLLFPNGTTIIPSNHNVEDYSSDFFFESEVTFGETGCSFGLSYNDHNYSCPLGLSPPSSPPHLRDIKYIPSTEDCWNDANFQKKMNLALPPFIQLPKGGLFSIELATEASSPTHDVDSRIDSSQPQYSSIASTSNINAQNSDLISSSENINASTLSKHSELSDVNVIPIESDDANDSSSNLVINTPSKELSTGKTKTVLVTSGDAPPPTVSALLNAPRNRIKPAKVYSDHAKHPNSTSCNNDVQDGIINIETGIESLPSTNNGNCSISSSVNNSSATTFISDSNVNQSEITNSSINRQLPTTYLFPNSNIAVRLSILETYSRAFVEPENCIVYQIHSSKLVSEEELTDLDSDTEDCVNSINNGTGVPRPGSTADELLICGGIDYQNEVTLNEQGDQELSPNDRQNCSGFMGENDEKSDQVMVNEEMESISDEDVTNTYMDQRKRPSTSFPLNIHAKKLTIKEGSETKFKNESDLVQSGEQSGDANSFMAGKSRRKQDLSGKIINSMNKVRQNKYSTSGVGSANAPGSGNPPNYELNISDLAQGENVSSSCNMSSNNYVESPGYTSVKSTSEAGFKRGRRRCIPRAHDVTYIRGSSMDALTNPLGSAWIKDYMPLEYNLYSDDVIQLAREIKDCYPLMCFNTVPSFLLRSPMCRIVIFDHNYKGLEAAGRICPHDSIIEVRGKVMTKEEYELHNDPITDFNRYVIFYRGFNDNTTLAIDAAEFGNEARYIRRSCRPNCYVRHLFVGEDLHFHIVSVTELLPGMELTIPFDYDYTTCRHFVECACGTSRCPVHRWIRSIQTRRAIPKLDYGKYIKNQLKYLSQPLTEVESSQPTNLPLFTGMNVHSSNSMGLGGSGGSSNQLPYFGSGINSATISAQSSGFALMQQQNNSSQYTRPLLTGRGIFPSNTCTTNNSSQLDAVQ